MRKIRPFVVAEMAETARLEALRTSSGEEEDKDTVEMRSRPEVLLPMNFGSVDGSQAALMGGPFARLRSDTTNSNWSGLTSPSMPHLPTSKEGEEEMAYFGSRTRDTDSPSRRLSF